MVGFPSLRALINLIEGKSPPEPWSVSVSPLFKDSLNKTRGIFPDIDDKLKKFIEVKSPNPLQNRYGKHDSPMTGQLKGFYHAHLRDDAIIIYTLKNRAINLICIVSHAEIEGGRLKKIAKVLSAYRQ